MSAADDPLAPHSLTPAELQEVLAVARAGVPFLVLRDGEGSLRLHSLGLEDGTHTIGRRPQADLQVGWDPEVSGLHAELQVSGGEATIVDDGLSRNGTFVDGRRVNGRHRLRDGDRVRVGQTVIVLRLPDAPAIQETVTAGETRVGADSD
ncbi:MAG: FHA domain-containing protein [Solirubrobacterales bacterium]